MNEPSTLFETRRLTVRRLTIDDVDALLSVYGDVEGMRFVGDGLPLQRDDCARWVVVTERNIAERGYGMSVIVDREDGGLVGFCGLVHPGGQEEAELKYALHRSRWGDGLASEAARGTVAWGRRVFGMSRVIATVAAGHDASIRVLQKCGFTQESERVAEDGSRTLVMAWHGSHADDPSSA